MRRCHHARIGRHSLLAACVLAALGGPVAAQPAGEFMTLDRGDHESRAGLFVGLLHLEDTDFDEGALRLEVHGQHVEPNGLGGYVAIPIHMVIGTEEGQDGATLAGVEVGGLLVRRLALGQELALRAGLVLPTAEGDEFDEFVVNFFAVQARLTDLVQAAPQTSTVRLGASWLGSLPGVIYRIDGGADVPLFTTLEGVDLDRDPVNLLLTEGEGGDFGDRSFSNAGVSLGLAVATLRVQGGLFLSVDSALEDDQDEGLVTFAGGATTSW
jgi:hypothetical protein